MEEFTGQRIFDTILDEPKNNIQRNEWTNSYSLHWNVWEQLHGCYSFLIISIRRLFSCSVFQRSYRIVRDPDVRSLIGSHPFLPHAFCHRTQFKRDPSQISHLISSINPSQSSHSFFSGCSVGIEPPHCRYSSDYVARDCCYRSRSLSPVPMEPPPRSRLWQVVWFGGLPFFVRGC